MKINRTKISLADAVLGLVQWKLIEDHDQDFILEAYSNGREQGHHLFAIGSGPDHKTRYFGCSFAENRNSDQIVVYVYVGNDTTAFSMQGNVPNDEVYRQAQYFRSTDSAAAYIVERMRLYAIGDDSEV